MAITQEAIIKMSLNGQQPEEELKKLTEALKKYEAARDKAIGSGDKKTAQEYQKKINGVNKEIQLIQRNWVNVNQVLNNLSLTGTKDLHKTLKAINNELNSGRVQRGSEEWDAYQKKLSIVNAELRKIREEGGQVSKNSFERITDFANRIWGAYVIGTSVYQGVNSWINDKVNDFAKMEEAESQVVKYTNLTKKEVEDVNEDFKKLDTRTAREQLNSLAGDAGKLGIDGKKNIEDFVDAGNQINIALGEDLGADAIKNIGKLAMIFGEDKNLGLKKAMLSTGSAINYIGQSSSAAEPYLADFLGEMGSVGHQAKISQANLLGYASVLDQNKVEASVASTAFQQLTLKMFQEPAKYAKIAGVSLKEFKTLLQVDSNKAMLSFLSGLSRVGDLTKAAPVIKSLGLDGQKAAQVLTALSGNIGLIEQEQRKANQAYNEATSITKEYNVQNNTAQARLEKMQKRAHDLAIELGGKLYPGMEYTFRIGSKLVKLSSGAIEFIKQNRVELAALTLALTAYYIKAKYTTVVKSLSNNLHKLAATYKTIDALATAKMARNQGAYNAILKESEILQQMGKKSLVNYQAAMYLVIAAKNILIGKFKEARLALNAFGTAIKTNPWGIAIAAIAAIGYGLYKWYQNQKEANRATAEFYSSVAKERGELTNLYNQLGATNQKSKMRAELIKEFNDKFGKYLTNLLTEKSTIADIKNAYEQATAAMNDYYARQVLDKETGDIMSKHVKDNGELLQGAVGGLTKATDSQKAKASQIIVDAINSAIQKSPNIGKEGLMKSINGQVQKGLGLDYSGFWNLMYGNSAGRDWHSNISDLIDNMQKDNQKVINVRNQLRPWIKHNNPVAQQEQVQNNTNLGGTPETGQSLTEAQQKKILEKKLKLIEASNDKEKIMNTALYAAGKMSKEEYDLFMEDSEEKLIDAKMKLYRKDSKEYNDLLLQKTQMQVKRNERDKAADIETIDQQTEQQKEMYLNLYTEQLIDKKSFDMSMSELEYDALEKKRNLYMKGSKEYNDYQAQMDNWSHNDRLQKQQEFEQRLQQIKEYSEKKTSDELMTEEIAFWDDYYSKLEGKEKEHQEIIAAIRAHYNRQKGEQEVGFDGNAKKGAQRGQEIYNQAKGEVGNQDNPGKDSIWDTLFGNDAKLHSKVKEKMKSMEGQMGVSHQDILNGMAAADEDYYNQLAEKAEKAYQVVGGLMSAYSSYVSASRDVEVAKTTKNYDNQIKAAGENTTKGKKLEEQKQKEIAKIKNKYNKKSTNIQIAQAIAETAVAALRAYAAGWGMGAAGPVLAPIFAGIATATGMIQVAAIKKQAQAQDEGYYSGGFTPSDSDNRKPVGTVHANEFIANHQATGNPNLLPVLRLIDHAQRNNTVGSLTAQDVSNAIGGGTSSPISTGNSTVDAINVNFDAVAASMERNTEVIDKLQQQLEGGIESYVTIDGEHGFERQYNHYKKLQSNKSR